MSTEVRVPALGESVTEATIATWFKKVGEAVAVDEMLCELETDKVTVEVPSPVAGTLGEIVAAEGETVGVDALLATINEGEVAKPTPAATPAPAATPTPAPAPTAPPVGSADVSAPAPVVAPPPKPEAPAPSGGNPVDVMVPALGESVTEATVSSWFKAVGDTVAADEMLCELETDKVSVEVPAPVAGVLSEILVAEGATVEASAKLAVISSGESAAAAPAAPTAAPAATSGKDIENAPSANKLMAEAGLSPDQVTGTGRDGRIMKEDVQKAVAAGATPPPAAAPASTPAAPPQTPRPPVAVEDENREERVKMTRLRQTIARRLKESQNTAAMLTT
jgi:2-oxoglutarate dehydrogenase E2 component (dihydrolipoamide succinyltransferase)